MANPIPHSIPSRPPGPHPTPEQLYRARRGPRNAEAERHLAHAAVCAECSEEVLRQEAFDDAAPMPQSEIDAQWERFGPPRTRTAPVRELSSPAPGRRVFQRFALAAAALLVLSLGFGLWNASQPRSVVPPQGGDTLRGDTERSAGEFQPAGTIAAPPAELVFPAGDGAPLRVTLYDADRQYSWTSPAVTDGRVELPEAERQKLRPGVTYYWTVLGDDSAPAQTFRIE